MTGYGSAAGPVGRGRVILEVKTVNHRYCEIFFKIPPRFGFLEKDFRELLQSRLQRGKIEIFLKEVEPLAGEAELVLNVPLAKQYQKALQRLQKELGIPGKPNPLAWTSLDHFIHLRENGGDYTRYQKPIERILRKALAHVQTMRSKEGAFLKSDQTKRLRDFFKCVDRIKKVSRKDVAQRRLQQASTALFNNEVSASPFTKIDVTEEVIRLESHARQYRGLLKLKEPVGRKLDFLVQEMHREMNTIGAKAANAEISQTIVESKSLLENLREQVQNIL